MTATVDDAEAGARLHIASSREVYGPLTEAALLESRLGDLPLWVQRWRRGIEEGPPRVLAVPNDEPVGFRVGSALLDRVLGDTAAYLWVHEENRRARSFYRRHGFAPDGGRRFYGPLGAWEIRMVRP